ncbi:response regulator [Geoalkalibacter sp.]|uniref:response regulator n=1 Tax=Geoalkalibacter sp. TaxID=3041440 RepID=UPI00272E8967|nr:response regulator [Geoalkalibacter sp.]
MLVRCPLCGSRYRVPAERLTPTTRIRCPKCNDVFSLRGAKVEMPSAEPAPGLPHPTRRLKVVIIEDARFFRQLVRDVLAPLNLDIHEAADGREGLALIRQERPHLVILDLNLPHLNGYELMRLVRAEPTLEHTRLLAMSGVFRKESDQEDALKAGADDFMGKSFTPDLFVERVRKLLDDKR